MGLGLEGRLFVFCVSIGVCVGVSVGGFELLGSVLFCVSMCVCEMFSVCCVALVFGVYEGVGWFLGTVTRNACCVIVLTTM